MSEESKDHISISYYNGALSDAIEQNNTKACIFFLQKITEIQEKRIETNKIILVLFTTVNIIGFIANAYFLLLK